MRSQPLIAVQDVEASSRWYCRILGGKSGHGGPQYERIICGDSFILQLHLWNDRDHPNLGDPDAAEHGYGVLLWFETEDFDVAVERAVELQAKIVKEPAINPNAHHREIWLRDLDGYIVVIAGPPEENP
jgi:catechol 2,3-dioxygenase-like lactoylglutathione lyase family enzyme